MMALFRSEQNNLLLKVYTTSTPHHSIFSAYIIPVCKKTEWWGAGVAMFLEGDADLHMAQLMPLPLTVSCFSKIQIGFTFLVPAYPGSHGQRAVKRVCVCVCVC